ncbi:hypothetical protein [Acidovorax facilis]|uniref:hypothetical protein n=1 Tax=Acidovorax facilis TaxID=12917 RepID=UPI003D65D275
MTTLEILLGKCQEDADCLVWTGTYVAARECRECNHVGINDESTDAACNSCDWSGTSPKEDHCPSCGKDGTMVAACPKCGGMYCLIAEGSITTPTAQAAPAAQQTLERNAVPAEWLEQAYREGWAACRDAETIGGESEDWSFGNSTANSRMIDAQQAVHQPTPTAQAAPAAGAVAGPVAAGMVPVAEVVECGTMGQQTLREIDGRWRWLSIGERLYAQADTGFIATPTPAAQADSQPAPVLDSLLNIVINHEARATPEEVRSMAAELAAYRAARAPADSVTAPAGGALRAQVETLTRDCGRQASKIAELIADLKFQEGRHREDRARLQALYEHQRGECWYWQGDGQDHLESLCNTLPVVIRADQLRALVSAPPTQAADSVLEDAAREAIEKVLALFPFNVPIQKFTVNNGPCLTADNDDEFYSVKRVLAFLTEIKTTLDAARKQGGKHD